MGNTKSAPKKKEVSSQAKPNNDQHDTVNNPRTIIGIGDPIKPVEAPNSSTLTRARQIAQRYGLSFPHEKFDPEEQHRFDEQTYSAAEDSDSNAEQLGYEEPSDSDRTTGSDEECDDGLRSKTALSDESDIFWDTDQELSSANTPDGSDVTKTAEAEKKVTAVSEIATPESDSELSIKDTLCMTSIKEALRDIERKPSVDRCTLPPARMSRTLVIKRFNEETFAGGKRLKIEPGEGLSDYYRPWHSRYIKSTTPYTDSQTNALSTSSVETLERPLNQKVSVVVGQQPKQLPKTPLLQPPTKLLQGLHEQNWKVLFQQHVDNMKAKAADKPHRRLAEDRIQQPRYTLRSRGLKCQHEVEQPVKQKGWIDVPVMSRAQAIGQFAAKRPSKQPARVTTGRPFITTMPAQAPRNNLTFSGINVIVDCPPTPPRAPTLLVKLRLNKSPSSKISLKLPAKPLDYQQIEDELTAEMESLDLAEEKTLDHPIVEPQEDQRQRTTLATTPASLDPARKETCCLLLQHLPLEIRELVYTELLVAGTIPNAQALVEDKLTTLVYAESQKPFRNLGIDSTILQTCRQIYTEALNILYGRNKFVFYSPKGIVDFSHAGLVQVTRKPIPLPYQPFRSFPFRLPLDCTF